MNKPYSAACERNQEPILTILLGILADCRSVLEIGSGTGQHAVYFARRLPHLRWHTSDLAENHTGIRTWLDEAGLSNTVLPVPLDMRQLALPAGSFDAIYSANTCHIMAWPEVENMFALADAVLPAAGKFCLYGPFNYDGKYTGEGNAIFDAALKQDAPHRGIRDIEAMLRLASGCNLRLQADHAMPANNRLLVFGRRLQPSTSSNLRSDTVCQ